ncbi:restriction endonuclease subunit S [Winogradskyella tangerina]|uniref:restriction endonuclease subunit S n=1 Tax=Winogradskyella tangerina TaxID=2023240 RepID=UPI000DBE8562|nr:restriction endonuclease subunit S [Winogradskyella tangerina]
MKRDWVKKRLTDFVWFQRGYDLPKSKFNKGDVPVYGATSILGYHNVAKVQPPGIITGRSGTLGKFQFAKSEYWPHNTSLWVRDFKGNDEKFAYYLLQCLDFSSFNSGGAVPSLNRNVLNAYLVEVPPLPTQRKIASILSAYDDLIENNEKRIKLLEEKAQHTYEEWFLRMKFPGYETTPINNERGLPEGWERIKIGFLVDLQQGFALNKKSSHHLASRPTKFPLLKISDLFNETETLFVKESIPKQFLVNKNEIIYSRTGQVGHAFIGRKGIIYNNCFRITPKQNLDNIFLYHFLICDHIIKRVKGLATGSAQPDLNHGAFKSIPIIIPPLALQKIFARIAGRILDTTEVLKTQNKRLKEARDILLPRLMTGMIDVEEIYTNQIQSVDL